MHNFVVTLSNEKNNVKIINNNNISINNKVYDYELVDLGKNDYLLKYDNKFIEVFLVNQENNHMTLLIDGKLIELAIRSTLQEKAIQLLENKKKGETTTIVKAPMPGMVIKIKKQKGEKVKCDEAILILEAMKMENELRASSDGILKDIFVKENSPVEKGAKLFSIE